MLLIESNAINGADSFLGLITDYAGIANCPLFDLALFDLFGKYGTVCAKRLSSAARTSLSNDYFPGTLHCK